MSDDETASSQPGTGDETQAGRPGASGPELTRRNFIYGSAAAAAAVAFLRGTGGRPGGPALRPAGRAARDRTIRPLTASPYLWGEGQSQSATPTEVKVTSSSGSGTNAGDAIVVCVSTSGYNQYNNSSVTVTDSRGNIYSSVFSPSYPVPSNGTLAGWIFVCAGSAVKKLYATSGVTVTFNAGGGNGAGHNAIVIGVPGVTQYDTKANATSTGSTDTPNAIINSYEPGISSATLVAMEVNTGTEGAISWNSSFAPVPVYGGGTITMVALSSGGSLSPSGLMVAGGDVEGYFTTDKNNSDNAYGDYWAVSNTGVYGRYTRDCACIAWSELEGNSTNGVVYACTGDSKNGGGGFLAATDNGKAWTLRSGVNGEEPQFAGNNATDPMPNGGTGWPRSTGNLLAQDPTGGGYLYAASYSAGPYRCSSPGTGGWGSSWKPMFPLSGGVPVLPGNGNPPYCRSLALHPNDPTTLFVATSPYNISLPKYPDRVDATNGYVWVTSGTAAGARSTTPKWTQLTGLPSVVEELFVTDANIYAACGYYGIYWLPLSDVPAAINNPAMAWKSNLNTGLITSIPFDPKTIPVPPNVDSPYWATLAAYTTSAGADVVVAFCDNPAGPESGGGFAGIVQVTNNSSPSPVALTTNLAAINVASYPIGNGNTQSWWHASSNYKNWVGGGSYTNAHLTIDQSSSQDAPFIYSTGDQGFYRYDPAGNPYKWQLAINGLPLFAARQVTVDPVNDNHIIFGDSDWGSWDLVQGQGSSSAHPTTTFSQVPGPTPGSPINNYPPSTLSGNLQGFALAFDPDPPAGADNVFVSFGQKYTNAFGDVLSRPSASTTWTTETGLYTTADDNVAIGLTVLRDSTTPNSNQYLLAGRWGSGSTSGGMWLNVNGKGWNAINSTTAASVGVPGQPTSFMPIAAPSAPLNASTGPSCVYVLDRGAATLYRGGPSGTTNSTLLKKWATLWDIDITFSGTILNDARTAFVALNPAASPSSDELWISIPGGPYKIAAANTSGPYTSTPPPAVQLPSPSSRAGLPSPRTGPCTAWGWEPRPRARTRRCSACRTAGRRGSR